MKARQWLDLLLLAALWGASFLFMRIAVPAFGATALAFVRVLGACLLLLPLLALAGQVGALRQHWRPLLVVGVINSALPFAAFAYAALAISGGLAAIFNAAAPLWAALIAWAWLGERPTRARSLGLALGFAGVLALALDKASLKPGEHGVSAALAVAACLAGTVLYGFAANYTRRHLSGVPSMAVAAGSQLAAALALALPGLWGWPAQNPPPLAWAAATVLALACTGAAYLLYFRLIAQVGPARAITVTFLVPAFAMLWGAMFIAEAVTPQMLAGGAVIVLGTALATGLLRLPSRWDA